MTLVYVAFFIGVGVGILIGTWLSLRQFKKDFPRLVGKYFVPRLQPKED